MNKWGSINDFMVVGTSYKESSLDTLAALVVPKHSLPQRLASLSGTAEVPLMLSTCNRCEVYGFGVEPEGFEARAKAVAGFKQETQIYVKRGREALRHLCRVTAGLESMMLGENQIAGQVRHAFEQGWAASAPTRLSERALQTAFRVSSRARQETQIAAGSVSVASAGAHLSQRLFSDWHRRKIAIVGAGETAALLAQHFSKLAANSVDIFNRTVSRATELASEHGGDAFELDALPERIGDYSVIAFALDREQLSLRAEHIKRLFGGGLRAPLVLLDISLPRAVEPQVSELTNVFLYDLSSLERVVDENLNQRRAAVNKVEGMITEECMRFEAWLQERSMGPLISALRESVEAIRAQEVERHRKNLSPEALEAVERVSRAVVNKLLHGPTVSIKAFGQAQDEASLQVLQQAFLKQKDQDESP